MKSSFEDDRYSTPQDGELQDREISLGMTTVLGIFFGLALICALFFGFGYSVGRKSVQAVAHPAGDTTPDGTSAQKPDAGSTGESAATPSDDAANAAAAASAAAAAPIDPSGASDSSSGTAAVTVPTDSAAPAPAPATEPKPTAKESRKPSRHDEKVAEKAPPPPPPATPTGSFVVQIAAVSHQQDADILVSTLKKRGYSVTVRHGAQDKLLHVQLGPYATHKDADAMRQRLLADGYNAIVK
ncbi:MAG: SPOR domain-containing protein [Acidobacteriota bacterium]|nr:SPOR domain-containing protein [Acidobacteriota bacterium]